MRNRASHPGWPDNLEGGANGGDFPMPEKVPFTIAGRCQPVVDAGRVFIGDMDGRVYGLALDDGKTRAENMFFHKLDLADDRVLAKTQLNGQSYRLRRPMLWRDSK